MFVKICGVTTEEDALLAVALGADAVGMVFAPSPRRVTLDMARDIARRLPPEIMTVGVFRDEMPARVVEMAARSGLKGAQLHGAESLEAVAWVRQRLGFVIRALPAGHAAIAWHWAADAVLIDGPSPGSGQVFDWRTADGASGGKRVILAGGLDPSNVAEAIARVRPWGVDVSSGVESRPGRKDPAKLRSFVVAAKAAMPADQAGAGEGRTDDTPYDWQLEQA